MPRFRQAHLYDYHPAAVRVWGLLVAVGAACVGWALFSVLAQARRANAEEIGTVLAALMLVGVAAAFPVRIPRSSYAVTVSDVFTFLLLAGAGPGAAVLAAAVDGSISACRASQRVAPRLSTPAVGAMAMFFAGHAQEVLQSALAGQGLAPMAATFASLCAAAPLFFVVSTLAPTWLVSFKQRRPFEPAQWWGAYSWVLALYLTSAAVAAVLHVNSQQMGIAVSLVGAAVCLAVVSLLRYALNRQEWERRAQEARIAEAQREAQVNQQRFTAAFTHAAAGMVIVGPAGQMLQVNRSFCELVSATEEVLLGKEFASLLHAGDAELFARQRAEVQLHRGRSFSIELRLMARNAGGLERPAGTAGATASAEQMPPALANGHDIWVSLQCSHFDDPGQTGTCLIYQLHDISSRRQAESRLQHVAFHDSLTDLANRHYFQQRLAVAVERARQDPARRFAVMFLDLDRFKLVNDSLGHVAGNHLLREVARRLVECVRSDDLVARLGGDEFAVLLESPDAHEIGPRLADRVLAALGKPLVMHGTEVIPAASIGITYSGDGRRSVDEVQRDADLAMYEAKAAGRGRVLAFDGSMHARIADKLALEADLRRAIGAGQLSVMFQPIYQLEPYRLVGFEALARWVHPERGPITPSVFVTLAEEAGHIEALTQWMLDHALQQLAHWQRHEPHLRGQAMQVNISGRDLQQAHFAAQVQLMLRRHGVAPEQLTLEITETTLMGELDKVLGTMQQLRAGGVRLSIDDFGTGYSSLAYLSTLPIDSLKIDRSFVAQMENKPHNVEIVRAVMNLGTSLGKRVVAEGIETPAQLKELRALGVQMGQGYLLSPPLRADQVGAALAIQAVASSG